MSALERYLQTPRKDWRWRGEEASFLGSIGLYDHYWVVDSRRGYDELLAVNVEDVSDFYAWGLYHPAEVDRVRPGGNGPRTVKDTYRLYERLGRDPIWANTPRTPSHSSGPA